MIEKSLLETGRGYSTRASELSSPHWTFPQLVDSRSGVNRERLTISLPLVLALQRIRI
jgi:hypothetical protein